MTHVHPPHHFLNSTPGRCPAIIDGTRFQCRAGGPTTSASVGDLERGAPCPLYHPLFPPCLRRFSPLVSHCPKRPCPIHRVGPYHALLPLTTSRWHCVCTGFRRDTNYHTRHLGSCERRGTSSLPPALVHLVARMPHSTRRPSAPRSRFTTHWWLQCLFPTSYMSTNTRTPHLFTPPPLLTPAVCTHAPRTSPTTFLAVFHPPTHPPLR